MEILIDIIKIVEIAPPFNSYIQLTEHGGTRTIDIIFQLYLAHNAAIVLREEQIPKPIIHQSVINMLINLGANIEKVVITDLVDGYFQSNIYVKHENKVHIIDAPVVDAIILSFFQKCPIFVDEKVFGKADDYWKKRQAEISDEEALEMLENIDISKLTKN